jgi:hypothetical protein
MENLYVFNPDTKKFVPAKEWLKDPDPTRAQLVGFRSGDGILAWAKKSLGDLTFDAAQRVAATFKVDGIDAQFRCPTRREIIDYQDALDNELDRLLDEIGGESSGWAWTCESWFARRNSANGAWFYGATGGYLHNASVVYNAYRCQAVALLPISAISD